MGRMLFAIYVFLLTMTLAVQGQHQQRFPKPEFDSGYVQPQADAPEPRSGTMEWIDVIVLIAALSGGAFFVIWRRSRKGVLWLSVLSLAYFGFFREGCICSVGSLQNIALSLFSDSYAASLNVLAFFILPLVFALLFGRVFCGSVCPLGVLQDLVVLKPVKLPAGLQAALGLFPYLYLGFAVLFAATGTDFIICRYDPFVGIFRLGAPFYMVLLGIGFLLVGIFVARPYCRFVCPYGVLLRWMSYFSQYHLTITPDKCIECRLCADSCPFDAIVPPTGDLSIYSTQKYRRKFLLLLLLVPVFALSGGYLLSHSHSFFARADRTVYLADMLIQNPEMQYSTGNLDIETFMASGKSLGTLAQEAAEIRADFYKGTWILGLFLGLVFGIALLRQVVFRRHDGFSPHKGDCVSCARCFDYCPVTVKNQQKR
ncbi:MAG: 4Fe-4S binding protein [Bacteroidia bacterium]|nr:4Fe-4S binding protein [Bacteroidia bacterium]